MLRSANNYYRSRIIKENLLDYLEEVGGTSGRNKDIIRKYVAGINHKTLSVEYGVTTERIRAIIGNYVVRAAIIARS